MIVGHCWDLFSGEPKALVFGAIFRFASRPFLTGFFEWKAEGKRKQPFHFHRHDRKPFLFAGLWERWTGGEGAPLLTCCLITTDANGIVSPVHNRMPVILTTDAIATWLDPNADAKHLQDLLAPAPDDLLEAVAVSRLVNSPKN